VTATPTAALGATSESGRRRASRLVLAAVLLGAGALHFAVPRAYEPLIPPALGPARPWVYGSGVAEAASGLLLAVPRTRRIGAWAVFAVLLAIWPGNVWMALEGGHPSGGLAANPLVAWGRVPLQLPLLWWAHRHTSR